MVKSNFSASVISGVTSVLSSVQTKMAPALIIGLWGFSVGKMNKHHFFVIVVASYYAETMTAGEPKLGMRGRELNISWMIGQSQSVKKFAKHTSFF